MSDIFDEAIAAFGADSRLLKMGEEATELALAVIHYQQGKISIAELCEEIAGVQMTIDMSVRAMDLEKPLQAATLQQLQKLRAAIGTAKT